MRTLLYVIGWALLFWLVTTLLLWLGAWSFGAEGDTPALFFVIPLVAGGFYERIGAFVAVTLLAVIVLLFALFNFVGIVTGGGECSLDEVECGQVREFVASDAFAAVALPPILATALGIAWLGVLRRPRD